MNDDYAFGFPALPDLSIEGEAQRLGMSERDAATLAARLRDKGWHCAPTCLGCGQPMVQYIARSACETPGCVNPARMDPPSEDGTP